MKMRFIFSLHFFVLFSFSLKFLALMVESRNSLLDITQRNLNFRISGYMSTKLFGLHILVKLLKSCVLCLDFSDLISIERFITILTYHELHDFVFGFKMVCMRLLYYVT